MWADLLMNQSTKSDFNVEVVRITSVDKHPNADRLSIYQSTAGYPVVDRIDTFEVGDLAVYIPVDAIVPLNNPAFAFLKKREGQTEARIQAVRLRKVYSEGLLIPVTAELTQYVTVGQNVQETLGIRKFQSRDELLESLKPGRSGKKRGWWNVSGMPVYGLDSLARFQDAIKPGTPVVITEKIHGCNARYRYENGRLYVGSHKVMRGDTGSPVLGWFKRLWKRILNRGHVESEHGDIWWRIAEQYQLKERLSKYPGLTFYGEIYGKGLQVRGGVDFCYDAPDGLKFRVFDIWDDKAGAFLPYTEMLKICSTMLDTAPLLYRGPWRGNDGIIELAPNAFPWRFNNEVVVGMGPAHIREGYVIRTDVEMADKNRTALKYVSPEYKLLGGKVDK
jgi:RNA ligase (TIGR02306 family)